MSNNFFQFKQFRINQDRSVMKVTTEGCLLGALAGKDGAIDMLDIGSGTGLIALMLAQRLTGHITTVEADADSCAQAIENVRQSPWSSRISVEHSSIQEFAVQTAKQFDLIVSNPPFYTNYLQSDNIKRNLAKHTYSLSMNDLVVVITKLLKTDGIFYVLYPPYEAGLFAQLAEKSRLYPHRNVIIRNKPDGSIFRMITAYGRNKVTCQQKELLIRNSDNIYSDDLKELLRDYYLAF